ncbi:hypothetical protein [Nitrosopumilus sp.]|uniref:hypothetical protein n=1 Tax=Nitrosopumilus sp. TaxID=2024843 RepID=UPI00262375EC|nr:hypothetical protein [Nitrosopumilus sp.]
MLEKLRTKIGTEGKIFEDYGGYEILVLNSEKFPWKDVFEMLIDSGFQVWIVKNNSHIQIESKPEVN